MRKLNYLVLNLRNNNIKDEIGKYIGLNINNMSELGYLDLNLVDNKLGK